MPNFRLLPWLATVLLSAAVIALCCSHTFYGESMVSPYFAAALAGAAIIHACIRPPREFVHVVGVTLVLWGFEIAVAGVRASGIFLIVPTISLLGLSAFLLLGIRAAWARGSERRMLLYGFFPALIFAGSDWFASELLAITERLHPQVWDFYLYSFDASLIWQASPTMGKLFAEHNWFRIASMIVYVGLALPIALVYGLNLRKHGRAALPVVYAFLLTGPLGVVFYNLLPAMGPAHVFGRAFPFHLPDYAHAAHLVPTLVALSGPRNAIPSLHMGWVLLAWWNSKKLNLAARLLVLYFVVFTVFATLGTGEHYLVDLVLAFPFAVLLQAICKPSLAISDRQRWVPIIASLATILIWFALLKYDYRLFWLTPSIPWLFSMGTVVGAIGLHHWLQVPQTEAAVAQPSFCGAVGK
jgi:PAP2 superfamily